MCPLWPLHLVILYLLALAPLFALCQQLPQLTATFFPNATSVHLDEYDDISFTVTGLDSSLQGGSLHLMSLDRNVADVETSSYQLNLESIQGGNFSSMFRLNGIFLGKTAVVLEARTADQTASTTASGSLEVTITRPERLIDTIFVASVATFVSLIFINFGCAMHWPTVVAVCKRPIGPVIGMVGQFLVMPLSSYVLGLLIFPDRPDMRLGLFFTGVSPGGGASNVWTFILGGNLNMSLAMTTMSTLASFGFMPLWIFTLGATIFASANLVVPYRRIATFIIGLIVPLGIGLAMQKVTPRLAQFMVRILKGFSSLLLLFIIVFAIVTNLYIFRLFTWEIIVAGMGLPWIGYSMGYLIARLLKQPHPDALAISIETGVQNTGISIFLLRFALPQPEADLTTVVPVSVAIMTPVPMTIIYIYQRIKECIQGRNKHKKMVDEVNTPLEGTPETTVATIEIGPTKEEY